MPSFCIVGQTLQLQNEFIVVMCLGAMVLHSCNEVLVGVISSGGGLQGAMFTMSHLLALAMTFLLALLLTLWLQLCTSKGRQASVNVKGAQLQSPSNGSTITRCRQPTAVLQLSQCSLVLVHVHLEKVKGTHC